jgi:diketogulonate reductase-like aldo/keto reductase
LGANFIDTAEIYGTEPVVGEAVKGMRDRVFIASKVSPGHFRRAALLEAADRSLQLLKTEYLDLYQLHFPNYNVPIEETMGAMEDLVDAGKIRFVGVSNFSVALFKQAQRAMRKYPIVSNQLRYSVVERSIEPGLVRFCQEQGVTIIAFSPLGEGMSNLLARDPKGLLRQVADQTGKTIAQVALNWCLAKLPVVAISSSSSPAHVAEDCAATGWRLTDAQMRLLNSEIRYRRRGLIEAALRRLARRVVQKMKGT